ncbi:hypothetical protein EPUS_00850 [Endocarpon pusillum Z07020]|uniref:Dolichyl-diphosphooligosaccharide--protein glycosyltransferase subunit OST2 n=1 Tax=Endocarpon pusillum (strain Z07020 / HMAS-L-300199) TaxID=1263415 RepID=U1G831_ENDPU|nr:uncharacterized protein EPUS_00850 [Endocarpon pusillum Z07020]ERF73597.1 hypothetical protein EPUS_00850 [Endocarpon pusillum Z07020]
MAKKPAASSASTSSRPSSKQPSSSTTTTNTSSAQSTTKSTPPSSSLSSASNSLSSKSSFQAIALHIWNDYLQNTPPRTFLLDAFMAFLVVIGGLQFLYAILFGNYPFNAFLSGFCAAVGQFVLTASLRMQTVEKLPQGASADARKAAAAAAKRNEGSGGEAGAEVDGGAPRVSSERAFADYVFGSLILHGFCVNFIN